MKNIKRIIDILMTLVLIPLMAYQVTGESAHEWLGITMVLLVIIHQVLNRKWYSSLFKGNYQAFRILSTTINVLLLISFALTAISGMSMSNHAVPFLYNLINVNTARIMHLAFSYWSFILMGMHIGLHISAMTIKTPVNIKKVLLVVLTIIAGYGFYLFLKSGIINYISFKSHFAFLDYEKPAHLVFAENVAMLIFFSYISHNIANIVKGIGKKDNDVLKSLIYIMPALIIGFALNMLSGKETFLEQYDFNGKTIIPFCSHGGGRFGQSITAITKLAPNSKIGKGLSIHYSGGSSLSSDVKKWLVDNNLVKSTN